MWIFSDRGFVSMVQDRKDPNMVWVRGRIAGDIEALLPAYADKVFMKPGADYLYRLLVPKAVLAVAVTERIMALDYQGHAKENMNKAAPKSPHRMTALYACWSAMEKTQYPYAAYQKTLRVAPKPLPSQSHKQGKTPMGSSFQPIHGAPSSAWASEYDWEAKSNGVTGWQGDKPMTLDDYTEGSPSKSDAPIGSREWEDTLSDSEWKTLMDETATLSITDYTYYLNEKYGEPVDISLPELEAVKPPRVNKRPPEGTPEWRAYRTAQRRAQRAAKKAR